MTAVVFLPKIYLAKHLYFLSDVDVQPWLVFISAGPSWDLVGPGGGHETSGGCLARPPLRPPHLNVMSGPASLQSCLHSSLPSSQRSHCQSSVLCNTNYPRYIYIVIILYPGCYTDDATKQSSHLTLLPC